jgi:DNA invertase Pin-like site-specific DNA recombinase
LALARKKIDEPASTVRLIGYARVSTQEQNLDMQVSMLKKAGVKEDHLFIEKVSAASKRRPQFNLMKKMLQRGDTLVVYSLSRVARDLGELIKFNRELLDEGVALLSLTEMIDTRTAAGKLAFNLQGAFAQFERDLTVERTRHGIAVQKEAGVRWGRKLTMTPQKVAAIKRDLKRMSVKEAAAKHEVSAPSIYQHIKGGRGAVLAKKK